jgi:hypothetical protein
MKKTLLYRPFKPFFVTGLATLGISLFIYVMYPMSMFDINVYNKYFTTESFKAWLWISAYLFFLAAIYYIAFRSELKTKNWLVITHYVFILLFLILFILFSTFPSKDMQDILSGLSIFSLLFVYSVIFFMDVVFFFAGLILFIANLFALNKNKKD